MRLVYAADLHGDIDSYRSLLDLAVAAGARAAIVGGDLLPHAIRLRSALQEQRDFIAERLRPLLERFRAQHPQIALYLLPGNDDWAAAIEDLDQLEQDGLLLGLHERVHALSTTDHRPPATKRDDILGHPSSVVGRPSSVVEDGLWLAGYACVPLTPFSIKDYERRDDGPLPPFSFGMAYTSWGGEIQPARPEALAAQPSIGEALAALAERSDPQHTIYVCHTPPFGTPLDAMPRGRHVGSKALRAFIERHTPPLTLHGHVHEAPEISGRYAARLGPTWSINPGHDPKRFCAVALDTDDIEGTIEHTVFGRP
jgi:Icc-related predicted phosphoesterase